MGKNKQVNCKVCYREMRSDNVKRHMKLHLKLQPVTTGNEEIHQEILQRMVDNDAVPTESESDLKRKHDSTLCEKLSTGETIHECDICYQEMKSITCNRHRKINDGKRLVSSCQTVNTPYLLKVDENMELNEKLINESREVLKIYKLLQRMKQPA